ncbi:similar to CDP-glucose 4,6-dehydratase [Hydrogenimonas sp.]|nr:similar to CDP-glucose 4,6-dehydratase [Hydrogenimonas sp.]
MTSLFNSVYRNRTVLVTGHTGFKGSWLVYWLKQMGANVIGYSLEPSSNPNHFTLLDLNMISVIGDIRDQRRLDDVFQEYRPEIVFHLAAQPLVRLSYEKPVETYETNVIGTLKVFEACRKAQVKAIVNITSDKAYDNREWVWGYRENDPMGGHDPYSSSKGCAEILTSSYRNSYFNLDDYGKSHNTLLASCRAGNVIGGGDWAQDRLVTDIMTAASKGEKTILRNPNATRPWQHVLEPLSGYLHIGQKLLEGQKEFAEGWNFGPADAGSITVEEVVKNIKTYWDKVEYVIDTDFNHPHEANLLKLDCSKAYTKLKWQNVWDNQRIFETTTTWYKEFYEKGILLTQLDLEAFISDAKAKKIEWTLA